MWGPRYIQELYIRTVGTTNGAFAIARLGWSPDLRIPTPAAAENLSTSGSSAARAAIDTHLCEPVAATRNSYSVLRDYDHAISHRDSIFSASCPAQIFERHHTIYNRRWPDLLCKYLDGRLVCIPL